MNLAFVADNIMRNIFSAWWVSGVITWSPALVYDSLQRQNREITVLNFLWDLQLQMDTHVADLSYNVRIRGI